MAYATYSDVATRLGKTFTVAEQSICTSLLDRVALMIDSYEIASDKSSAIKKEVSVNTVSRVMADATDSGIPVGATQGSMSAMGYSQSWTVGGGGSVGEMYFSKYDKKLLGIGNQIGSYSPVEELVSKEE